MDKGDKVVWVVDIRRDAEKGVERNTVTGWAGPYSAENKDSGRLNDQPGGTNHFLASIKLLSRF